MDPPPPSIVSLVQSSESVKMESGKSEISSAQAVLLGALAPGVNVPTWNTLKSAFLLLGFCLSFMLTLLFSASQFTLLLHVGFLLLLAVALFLLLSWFLAQTGLVSVESQMQQMNLEQNDRTR